MALTEWIRVQNYDTGDRAHGQALHSMRDSSQSAQIAKVSHIFLVMLHFLMLKMHKWQNGLSNIQCIVHYAV